MNYKYVLINAGAVKFWTEVMKSSWKKIDTKSTFPSRFVGPNKQKRSQAKNQLTNQFKRYVYQEMYRTYLVFSILSKNEQKQFDLRYVS